MKIIMVEGLNGSGKSTFIKKYLSKYPVFKQDVPRSIHNEISNAETHIEIVNKLWLDFNEQFNKFLKENENEPVIIMDRGWVSALAYSLGNAMKFVYRSNCCSKLVRLEKKK